MTTAEFLNYIKSLDIRLWADGDRMGFSAPPHALTPELREELSARKAEILALLQRNGGSARGATALIAPVTRDQDLPLSFAQQRLWFLDKLEPGSTAYNISPRFRLHGPLDVEILQRSFAEIVRRHEALRTTFSARSDSHGAQQPLQKIHGPESFTLAVLDLRVLDEADRHSEAERIDIRERNHRFDLERGPLFRATLVRETDTDSRLLLTLHHIICDGWSLGVLMREWENCYNAFVAGKPSPLTALPVQVADCAVWQRQRAQSAEMEAHLAYWRQQMAGCPPVLQLPTDRPRPAMQTFRGRNEIRQLSPELTAALKALSRREGCTLFMTLLAAFQTLLCRYTAQTDLCVGAPIANRQRAEIEGLIGFFANTLALRTDLSGNPTFRELLGRVRSVALGAYAHQDLPFERLVEELQPERNLSYSPLFQVMFVLQNAPMQPLRLTGLAPSELEYPGGNAKFDLTLFTEETSQGLTATAEYNTDLFDRATIVRMLEQYSALLSGVVTDPGQRLAELPLLPDGQRRQLLVDWNATEADYPSHQSLQRLFEAQVARTPEALALDFGTSGLTYRELNRRANQLAHALRGRGVDREVCVGICLPRSFDMIVAVLGILKAGGAYVPLDPELPRERLAFMIEDARLQILLTTSALVANLPVGAGATICLDTHRETIAQESEENPGGVGTPDDLVYVTYTSGSTGKPKGIAMTQRPLRNLLHWMLRTTQLPERARTLQFASLSFDVSFQDIFSTLCSGGTLVLITEAMRRDIGGLWSVILAKSVHRIFMPAVALQQLAEGFRPEAHAGAALRKIISGSEQLMVTQAISTLFNCLKNCRLHNEYGPSETHVVTELALPECPDDWAKRPAIGKPIANTRIYLLDAAGEPVPIGVTGELYIGGDGLARGYLNRPEEMGARFVPDPFRPASGGRLYRTGDLARYLPNGDIEFLGRRDHQLKIRGYRIEAGEIETALEQHPQVREAVVIAREHSPTDRRLVAYLVFAASPAPTVTALRDFLAQKLPEYMIPSAFVPRDVLPLNANGKVDRKALPAPDTLRPELAATYAAPTTGMERQLATIWQETLALQQVGVYDNFFDLGGHSLLIVQVQSRLRAILAREVAVIDLFRYPTISSLARFLAQAGEEPPSFQGIHDRARKQRDALARRQPMAGGNGHRHSNDR